MSIKLILSTVCVFLVVQRTHGANILSIFVAPSKSHSILGAKLTQGLLKRGHHVTFVSPFDIEPSENLTHYHLKSINEFKEKMSLDEFKKDKDNVISMMQHMIRFTTTVNELFWEEPLVKKLVKERPKYDLVIALPFFHDALLGLGPHLGAPTIVFNCIGANSMFNSYVANPTMVYSKNAMFGFSTDTFMGRLITVTTNMLLSGVSLLYFNQFNQGLLDKYLPNSPPLSHLQKNVSLVLANSHVSIEPARPYVPNMIQIGGFHVQDSKPLPEEFKKFLDGANQGAILFSLGSNVQIAMIDKEKQKAILKVLGELEPIRVIFKSELKHDNLPKNIMVKKWVPQADILGHPNLKLFISHGGLGGNTESVYHGVPILGIPFFGDQKMNLYEAQSLGYAAIVEIEDLTEELFRSKIKEILTNPKYTQNVKRRSALMREQPVKPMDNAVFWVEHIIKFGGGSHLQNAGVYLAWYQLYMVDIYVFYTVVLALLAVLNIFVIKLSIRVGKRLFGKSKSTNKQSKKVKKH